MPWSFQLYFALLIATLYQISQATAVKATVWSSSNRSTLNGFSEQELKCVWRCKVNRTDINNSINTAFTEGKILIILRFDYLRKVDKKCVNQELYSSSKEETEHWHSVYWQIWLVNNKLPSSANNAALRYLFSSLAAKYSWFNGHAVKGNNCTLNILQSTYKQNDFDERSPRDCFEKILRSTIATLGELCNTEVEGNDQQTCIKISERAPSFSGWAFCGLLFMTFFTYFAPTLVCLYSATEVTHEGIRKISLEGASPVGFRSLIGNYFFSTERTMWHRKFIMRVFILPIPLLVPAIFFEYLLYHTTLSSNTNLSDRTYLFQPFRLVCYGCYCIQAFYFPFVIRKVNCTSSCVCYWDRESKFKHRRFIWTCSHQELSQRMTTLLRIIWAASVLYWSWLIPSYQDIKDTKSWIVTCYTSCDISVASVVQFLRFIIYICLGFLAGMLYCYFLIIWAVMYILVFGMFLSPIATLCISANFGLWHLVNFNFCHRYLLFAVRYVVVLLDICMSCLAAIGVMSVLRYAAVGIVIFLQLALPYVLSEENLPFLSCCVLVSSYLWYNYRSFTKKYQDLGLKLFEEYNQLTESACTTDLNMQGFTSNYGRSTIDDVKRISKELFYMACEELMPIRKSICTMMLKATLSVAYVLTVYSLAMLLNFSPVTKTMLTFVAGSIPKIIAIYIERSRKQILKPVPINEKARKIVHEYINIRNPCNQGEKNLGASEDLLDLPAIFIITMTAYVFMWGGILPNSPPM